MNVLSRKQQQFLLEHFCEGTSVRSLTRLSRRSPNTVRGYLTRFGEALAAVHDRVVRNLVRVQRVQADELWGFVYAKRDRNVSATSKRAPPDDIGAYWTWVGYDPDSKLLITWHVGDRTLPHAIRFALDLRQRLVGRVMITTDGHPAYPEAFEKAFHAGEADHVVLEKDIKGWWDPESGDSGTKVFSLKKKIVTRDSVVDLSLASTSLIERMNGTFRNFNARLMRRRITFSKRLTNHIHAQAIFAVYYNFVKEHGGFKGPERHWTPAIKAGLTNRPWDYEDLLDEIDAYWERKAQVPQLAMVAPREYGPLPVGQTSPLPFFVIHSSKKGLAKVHKGTCRNCQHGIGRKEGGAGRNDIYAFATQQEAWKCAQALAPLNPSLCSICVIGKYAGNSVRQQNTHRKSQRS